MTERASIFAPREELDIGGFAPKSGQERRPDPSEIDQVRSSRFRSRESQPAVDQPEVAGQPPVNQSSTRRPPMVYRTGRNTTFSVKTTPETVETFYEIARAEDWKAGETFEKAIAALKRELAGR